MKLRDIAPGGVPMHGLALTDITLDELDDCAFTAGIPLRGLSREQLVQLDPAYRLGIPRRPRGGDAYLAWTLDPDDGWTPMHACKATLNAAADEIILAAVIGPSWAGRVTRGRRTVLVYDPASRMVVSG
ncbi:hypothetical protein [uncultured Alistipes sp.]|uniref:hypothetical protein n=1 Tax=uncultured Alistipes sp. TaxID=538949 RepID=UPI00272A8BE0|nr:hypothetical protein [uncultured Alistipes sp.]